MTVAAPLLAVENLSVTLATRDGVAPVIDDLSFSLEAGGSLSIVGESGCGKSMTALALMGLLPQPVASVASGRILLDGEDLTAASEERLRAVRGNDISMVFQEPMTSLNPVYTIGEQIAEVLRRHRGLNRRAALDRAVELLDAVRIPDPARRVRDYPHQLSGGQRQRVVIAIALACEPRLLIADEPTTALDVTVQAQIFELLADLQARLGTAILLITHDMGVVAEVSTRMMVMYAGRKVEEGRVRDVVDDPRHPYTRGLIACVPDIGAVAKVGKVGDAHGKLRAPLAEIPGIVPSLTAFGAPRCLFASRCRRATQRCLDERPAIESSTVESSTVPGEYSSVPDSTARHSVACWHPGDS